MGAPMPNMNWAGMSLQQKYQMMHSGPGGSAVAPCADSLNSLAQQLNEAADTVRQGLSGIGVDWKGDAATSFNGSMQKAQQWLRQSSQVPQAGGTGVHTYASSYDSTKNAIPNPSEFGPLGSVLGGTAENQLGAAVVGGGLSPQSVNLSAQIAALRRANAQADQALTQHVNAAQQAVNGFPQMQPPPPLTNGGGGSSVKPNTAANRPGAANHSGGTAQPRGAGGQSGGTAGQGGADGVGGGQGDADGAGGGRGGPSGQGGGMPTSPGVTKSSSYAPPPPVAPAGGGDSWGGGGVGRGGGNDGGGVARTPLFNPGGGGFRAGPIGPPVQPPITRTVIPAPNQGPGYAGGYTSGNPRPTPAQPSGAASGGMPPGGMGGMGAAGQGREHRNSVFIPSDHPFRIPKEKNVAPPVLGLEPPDFFDDDDDFDF
jgi:hypothetical protein